MAQELLTTFDARLGEVALVPGTGGVFRVLLDGELLWDRAEHGGFPEVPALKRLVRDRIAPDRSLGHTDRAAAECSAAAAVEQGRADPTRTPRGRPPGHQT